MTHLLPDSLIDEVHGLTLACINGEAAAEDIKHLDELLLNNEAARRVYTHAIRDSFNLRRWAAATQLHAGEASAGCESDATSLLLSLADADLIAGIALDDVARDATDEVSPATAAPLLTFVHNTVGYFSSGWPVAYLVATVILGVGMFVGTLMHVSQPVRVATQPAPLPSFVGRITGMVDCQWVQSPESRVQSPALDPRLSALISLGDTFALTSGLMEITYDTGAKVILQGPVTYNVESRDGGYLSIGKLTAKVEKRGERKGERGEDAESALRLPPSALFFIRTPTAIVTDLGTEFGVEVDEQGGTNTHLFRGIVEVQPAADGEKPGKTIRLSENESVRVEASGDRPATVLRGVADPTAFVHVEQLPKLAEEQRLKAFRVWQSHSEQLRRDSSLLAYYDFQRRENAPAILFDVAQTGGRPCNGTVKISPLSAWSAGHTPGKHALSFQTPADHVRVVLPQTTDDLTLAARVCVMSVDGSPGSLLMSEKTPVDYVTTVLADNPVAYWRLGETKGKYESTAGSEHPGEDWFGSVNVKSSLSRGQIGPPPTKFPGFGPANKGIALANKPGGTPTGFVSVANSTKLQPGTGNWSVEAWAMANTDYAAAKSEGYIVCNKDNGRNGFGLEINASGQACLSFAKADKGRGYTNEVINLGAPTAIALGSWHHFVGTMERNVTSTQDRFTFYVDGVQVKQLMSSVLHGESLTPSACLTIGAMNHALFGFNGSIDEVAVYNNALTAGQVTAHYAAVSAAPKPMAASKMGQLHCQITSEGSLCLGVGGVDTVHQSDPVITGKNLGRWINIAVVYDRAASRVRFYLDGRPIGESEIAKHVPIAIGPAWIGQCTPDASQDASKNGFRGRIEELTIFGRALNDKEIEQICTEPSQNK